MIFARRRTSCALRWDDNTLKLKILGGDLVESEIVS
jgi:hypothetical protein